RVDPAKAHLREGSGEYRACRLRGWLPGEAGRQALPLVEDLRATARLPAAGVPGPKFRVVLPGAEPLRAGPEPHDLRGRTPPHRPRWKTPQPFHKACERPHAAAACPAHAGRPEPPSDDPAGEPETPDKSSPGWRRRRRRPPAEPPGRAGRVPVGRSRTDL